MQSFLLKTLGQKNIFLTSLPTLFDFRPFSENPLSFKNQKLRTLKPSSISMASTSSNQEMSMQIATGESLQIKGRTMKLEGWQLTVQVENPVDFISLAHNGFELRSYVNAQDLNGYFNMLNGPMYENLVKYF